MPEELDANPGSEIASDTRKAESESYWGGSEAAAKQSEHPDKPAPDSGDKGDPADSGPEKPEGKKLAGKYETAEQLEKGYLEVNKEYTKTKQQLKEYEERLASRLDSIDKLVEKLGGEGAKDAKAGKPKGEGFLDFLTAANMAPEAIQDIKDTLGDDLLKGLDIALSASKEKLEQNLEKLNQEISEQKFNKMQEKFFAEHRDAANEGELQETMDKITADLSKNAGDPAYVMDIVYHAAKGMLLPKMIEQGVEKGIAAREEAYRKKMAASGITVGGGQSGGTGVPKNLAKKRNEDYWEGKI